MNEVVRYKVGAGSVLVEVEEGDYGIERVGRGDDGVRDAGRVLADCLEGVTAAARTTLDSLKHLSPDGIELEFGVKLAGEAGALIAKTSAEGHFVVKLTWERGEPDEAPATSNSPGIA